MKNVLLEIRDLTMSYHVKSKPKQNAVDGVSLEIFEGETLGLVGESGCGKTTLGRAVLNLYKPAGGEIRFRGKEIAAMKPKERRQFCSSCQMIFQDPYSSLNPKMRVKDIVLEGVKTHKRPKSKAQEHAVLTDILEQVGLNYTYQNRFPYEFSGGQRQRIGIARALAVDPQFIVCDEPVSALDVSIQAQIINLLITLQKERNLTYLFIAHDLSVVRHISDRIAVMYMGNIVELADCDQLYHTPMHPYTRLLLDSAPVPDPKLMKEKKEPQLFQLDLQTDSNGCKFCGRCPNAKDVCRHTMPKLTEIETNHFVACNLLRKV